MLSGFGYEAKENPFFWLFHLKKNTLSASNAIKDFLLSSHTYLRISFYSFSHHSKLTATSPNLHKHVLLYDTHSKVSTHKSRKSNNVSKYFTDFMFI